MTDEVKRDVKNTVFVDLFNQDEYRLQLFQTLHPEITDVTADELQIITIKRVITNHQYNDLAFVFRNKLMIFVEAQSTWSVNILIRLLLYLVETIQEYMHERNMKMHAKGKHKIPMPEFYVIFTGTDEIPKRISLKKDFFCSELCQIDLEAKVYNVETDDIIGQYIIFSHVMDEQIKKYGRVREAALETIRICRDRNVLKKYLEEREKEVVNIMIELFNQELAVKEYGDEREEKGRNEGMDLLARWLTKLSEMGKTEEADKAIKDPKYRRKLLIDYGLAEG